MKQHWLDQWEIDQDSKDYEDYIERAAIMEYDGKLSREDAEQKAKEIVFNRYVKNKESKKCQLKVD